MFQIDVPTAAAIQPAATALGTPGFFTDGNPATGTPASIVPAEFLNAVMLEILNVLSAAGITPVKSTYNQLATAISTLVNSGIKVWSATDTGTANTYTATLSPAPAAYAATQVVILDIAHTNTGASTLNLNSLGTKSVKKMSGGSLVALAAGDLTAGGFAILAYDGTQFVLANAAVTQGACAAENIGQGLEDDGAGNLRVKLNGATLARSASGLSLNLANANVWGGQQTPSSQTLTDASTVAWDASLGQVGVLTTAAARTIGLPTNLVARTSYRLDLTTGGYSPSWNAIFKFPGGTAPSGLSGRCIFDFYYDGTYLNCVGQSVAEA